MSHLFAGIMCLTSLAAYIFMNWVVEMFHRRLRLRMADLRCFASIPIGLILASPWLIVFGKQALTHDETSMAHYSLPGWNIKAKILGWTFTCYKPSLFWAAFPPLLWILAGSGSLICLYQVVRGNYGPQHVFLLSAAIIPTIVLFTPLYSPIVGALGEWMPSRFMKIVPVPTLAALSGGMIFQLLFSFRAGHAKQNLIIRSAGILLAFIAMLIIVPQGVTIQKNLYVTRNQVSTPLHTWDSDFRDLESVLKNKVVLTDPLTSYFLPYYTGAYTVAMPAAHGSPYINHEARLADASTMLNPQTASAERHELLDRYGVDYVMLNLRPEMDKEASRRAISGFYMHEADSAEADTEKKKRRKRKYSRPTIWDLVTISVVRNVASKLTAQGILPTPEEISEQLAVLGKQHVLLEELSPKGVVTCAANNEISLSTLYLPEGGKPSSAAKAPSAGENDIVSALQSDDGQSEMGTDRMGTGPKGTGRSTGIDQNRSVLLTIDCAA